MRRRQPLPRVWLFTDERQGDELWSALARLPRGAGVVFRHKSLPDAERLLLFRRVRAIAMRKNLLLLVSSTPRHLHAGLVQGWHGIGPLRCRGLRTAPAHNIREVRAAERAGAALVFMSPVFPTRSHPGAPALGPLRFGLLARQARVPVIALGGVDPRRARRLPHAYGWAGIDAWAAPAGNQKRKAVPRYTAWLSRR